MWMYVCFFFIPISPPILYGIKCGHKAPYNANTYILGNVLFETCKGCIFPNIYAMSQHTALKTNSACWMHYPAFASRRRSSEKYINFGKQCLMKSIIKATNNYTLYDCNACCTYAAQSMLGYCRRLWRGERVSVQMRVGCCCACLDSVVNLKINYRPICNTKNNVWSCRKKKKIIEMSIVNSRFIVPTNCNVFQFLSTLLYNSHYSTP